MQKKYFYKDMAQRIIQAAKKISECQMLLIGAGAGMGRDSGLPDFRGNQGFWNNYPPYRNKFDFYQCANPDFLKTNPNLFWGFYGSRLVMYRQKKPHQGFTILKKLSDKMKHSFVVTSNVDGHFQSQFPQSQIYEVHGSIHHLQCTSCNKIFQNNFHPNIDYAEMSCKNLPICQKCQQVLRPNILMFGDWDWIPDRTEQQYSQYFQFLGQVKKGEQDGGKLAIVQIGCGTAIPTIRSMCQKAYYNHKNSIFLRINPEEQQNSHKQMNRQRYFHIKGGALQILTKIFPISSTNF